MDLLEKYYGRHTFQVYGLFAKVPGMREWPCKIFVPFSILLLFLATIFQICKLVNEHFRSEVVINLLPSTTATGGTLFYIPYVAFTTEKEYRVLLSIILDDLREERSEEEEAIKRQYAKRARMFVNAFTALLTASMCIIPLLGLSPYFLDLITPLNESREMQLLFNGEIFVDQRKYFYHIYFLESCVAVVVGVTVGYSENMSFIVVQHSCGMFAEVGCRLEKLTEIVGREQLSKKEYTRMLLNGVRSCIEGHQRSLHFASLGRAFYDVPLTLVVIGTFCALTVSFVQVTDPQMLNTTIVFFTIAQVFQLFLLSCMGQNMIDKSEQVAVGAYNARWEICPPNVRQLLQMIILRSSKPLTIVASNMYLLSIENFMSIMQTITSFYMVIRQTL